MTWKMKNSDVDWLGSIPASWDVLRIHSLFRRKRAISRPDAELLSVYRDFGVVPKSSRDDNFNRAGADLSAYQYVDVGDLVLNKMKTWQGSIAISAYAGLVSPAYYVATPRRSMNLRFIHHLLRSQLYVDRYATLSAGVRVNQWDLSYDDFKNVLALIPSSDEQRRIAAWLDVQTERISLRLELLGNKRKLLRELRQSIIDEGVSTGFAKATPMETGLAALPKLPAGWSLAKFKNKVFFREGPGIMATDFTDAGVPLLRIGNITPGLISMAGCNFVAPEKAERRWQQFKLQLGDLVISASASTGIVSEASPEAVGAIPYTGLIVLRPRAGMTKGYLRFFVISRLFLAQIEDYLKGSTIQHFGPTHLRQMLIPVPPVGEQEEIARTLERRTSRIDAQIALIDSLETLLKEQRKAMIHEAVTGKIDLSAYTPQQNPEALAA